ncbi:DUF116 domain-containing protein [Methanobrevibacter sp. DSM 116169]|uniref:DUF116 domain-containing protein n=1 Tax=Methanobrevibacter sp. DSM 116169 TaxID=3242727 RepID=UPI0038FC2DAE
MSVNITYNIQDENYLKDLDEFTNLIVDESKDCLKDIINDYERFIDLNNYINPNYKEFLLEAISLGILWKNYSKNAVNLNPVISFTLSKLSYLRDNNLKTLVDPVKGYLLTKYYFNESDKVEISIKNLNKLIVFLKSSGEYNQSIKHLNNWYNFLKSLDDNKFNSYFKTIQDFTDFFILKSNSYFHKYTKNINEFLDENEDSHINKEDIFFIKKTESEYHLNIFASEIMNQVYETKFIDSHYVDILVPTCMKIKNSKCLAQKNKTGLKCTSCNKNCNIGKINFKNKYIISHSSKILKNYSKNDKKNLGIVGISCISNLIEGGWKLSSDKIPSQCVALDYASCKNHWDCDRFETNIDLNKLNKILNNRND